MSNQQYGVNLIPLEPISTTAFTAAAASASVSVGTNRSARVATTGAALWIKLGTSGVTATAGTASEILVPAGASLEIAMGPTNTHLAYIQDAATAKGSITIF